MFNNVFETFVITWSLLTLNCRLVTLLLVYLVLFILPITEHQLKLFLAKSSGKRKYESVLGKLCFTSAEFSNARTKKKKMPGNYLYFLSVLLQITACKTSPHGFQSSLYC